MHPVVLGFGVLPSRPRAPPNSRDGRYADLPQRTTKCAMIRFSIVVPNYNSGAMLDRCLTSLRSQNYDALETILLDSLSTDCSREVIEQHRSWLSQVVLEKDRGQAD